MKRASLLVALFAVLLATTSFAASKKFDGDKPSGRNDSSLTNGDRPGLGGSSVSGGAGTLTLSQDGASGGTLILAPGTPDRWKGGPGVWSDGTKWSGGVPISSSDVKIYSNGSKGNDVVTLDVGSTTIDSLKLGGVPNGFASELTDGGVAQTLTITNAVNVGQTGSLEFTGGSTVTANANSSNAGLIDLENGSSLTVNGKVTNSGTMSTSGNGFIGPGSTVTISGKLTNSGTFIMYGQAFAFPSDSATVGSLDNSGTVDLETAATLHVNNNATNSGTISLTTCCVPPGGPILTIGGTLTNDPTGSLTLYYNSTTEVNRLVNSGSVDIENGSKLVVDANATNSGSITTSALEFQKGANAVLIGGRLTNSGLFALYGKSNFGLSGTDFARLGGLVNTGTVHVGGGSELQVDHNVTNSGTLDTAGFPGGSGGGGNSILIAGMLTNNASGQITLYGPGDFLQASGGLTNNGVMNAYNGSVIDPPFVNNLGMINIDSLSKMVVGMGSPAGLGYIQLANGTLGEMISATNFGVINVNGSALLDGTLSILLQGGFNPSVGSMYKFLLANPGQISGTFASILNDVFNGGTEKWLVDYDNAGGFVELTAVANNVPEPATLLVLIPGLLGMAYGLRRRSVR